MACKVLKGDGDLNPLGTSLYLEEEGSGIFKTQRRESKCTSEVWDVGGVLQLQSAKHECEDPFEG